MDIEDIRLRQRRRRRRRRQRVLLIALITLYITHQKRQWQWRPAYEYLQQSFSLELMPPGRAKAWLRFTVPEIQRIAPLLQLHTVEYRYRLQVDATTALCVVCARLSTPGKWYPICDLFGRSRSWLSTVFNDTVLFLAATFVESLNWHPQISDYSRLKAFSRGVHRVGGVKGVWGFIDGTFRGHRRPGGDDEAQRLVYSGHKKQHGVNYQAIVTPDGLISSLTGPWAGPVNDWAMFKRSGCEEAIRSVMAGRETLYIYGDPAYSASFGVACPFEHPKGRRYLGAKEQAFNRALSSVRIAVEQAFGNIQVQWTYTAFSKGLSAGQQPVAAYFYSAVLLLNCYICLRRRTGRFLVKPPRIENYLAYYTLLK
jgi:DDE superfamily endonuclease